jgi:hypothetical protein
VGPGYCCRAARKAGRPRREYVGTGLAAELAAEPDAPRREQRAAETAAWHTWRAEVEVLDRSLAAPGELADMAASAPLLAASFGLTAEGLPALRTRSGGAARGAGRQTRDQYPALSNRQLRNQP